MSSLQLTSFFFECRVDCSFKKSTVLYILVLVIGLMFMLVVFDVIAFNGDSMHGSNRHRQRCRVQTRGMMRDSSARDQR